MPFRASSSLHRAAPLVLLLLGALLAPREAASQRRRGDNPYDREVQRLSRETESAGRRPEGILPLLEL